jgi:hypothetical protein
MTPFLDMPTNLDMIFSTKRESKINNHIIIVEIRKNNNYN